MARPLSVRGAVAKILLPQVSRNQLCRLLVWAAYTALKFAQVLIVGPKPVSLHPPYVCSAADSSLAFLYFYALCLIFSEFHSCSVACCLAGALSLFCAVFAGTRGLYLEAFIDTEMREEVVQSCDCQNCSLCIFLSIIA